MAFSSRHPFPSEKDGHLGTCLRKVNSLPLSTGNVRCCSVPVVYPLIIVWLFSLFPSYKNGSLGKKDYVSLIGDADGRESSSLGEDVQRSAAGAYAASRRSNAGSQGHPLVSEVPSPRHCCGKLGRQHRRRHAIRDFSLDYDGDDNDGSTLPINKCRGSCLGYLLSTQGYQDRPTDTTLVMGSLDEVFSTVLSCTEDCPEQGPHSYLKQSI